MSRSSRNRSRQRTAKAAPAVRQQAGGALYTAGQVSALMAQQKLESGNMRAVPLPSSPLWNTALFGPGNRLVPAPINVVRPDSGRAEPRLWEFPVSWNLQIDDRWHVPWRTLQRAADMPLFRKCIERRKSVCQLDFAVTVDPVAVAREVQATGSAKNDVESAMRKKYLADIARVTDWLQVPDRKNDMDWPAWTSLLMENRLKYDAAVVYPRKTYGGDLFALEIIDGRTVKPLLDEYGGRPLPPLPAFQQILYGFPRGEFTATADPGETDAGGRPVVPGGFASDTLYYERSVYRSESPYGMSPTEIALMDGLVWMRRMGWIAAEYTHGVTPRGLLEAGPELNWTPQQWEDWSRALNDHLRGVTEARQEWPITPPGLKLVQPQQTAEQYKPDYDLFLIKLVCGDFGIPASEVGFTEAGALGASFHEGEEDILYRNVRLPDMRWLGSYATKLMRREMGMPAALRVEILGLENEDEAAADAVALQRVQWGRMTLNEDRARRGEPAYTFAEADMPMLMTQRGMVFVENASKQAPPGELVAPAQAPPGSALPGDEAEPAGGRPGKAAKAIEQGPADRVYAQLTEDYPKASLEWVHHAAWEGPLLVPFAQLDMDDRDSWRASHEPDRVAGFAEKIRARAEKGKTPLKKPAVVVSEPGKGRKLIVDGHHRTLGSEAAGMDGVWAWVGHVHERSGPWMELHDLQFTRDSGSAPGAGDDTAAGQVGKELAALRKWLARHPSPSRPFECQSLTKADAPQYAADPRVAFKAGDAGPKALLKTGRAGSGTFS